MGLSLQVDRQKSEKDVKRRLELVIESGDETCASKPGEFCRFVRTTHLGTRWVCSVFGNKELSETVPNGWLARLPECKSAEMQTTKKVE